MQLSALILAGGESRRMGRDKAWVEFNGRPLIQLAVEKVRAIGVEELFISGRVGADYSEMGCPVLFDLEPGFGPMGGIERGLCVCASPLLLVLAVDLPRMTPTFLDKLATRCNRLTGVVPLLNERLEPLAAIYPHRCHFFARSAIAQGRYSARSFAESCLKEHAVRTLHVSAADATCFANCNTPSDLDLSICDGRTIEF